MNASVRLLSLLLFAMAFVAAATGYSRDLVLVIDVAAGSAATAACSILNAQSSSQVFVCGVLAECPCLGPASAVMAAGNLLRASANNTSTLTVTVHQGNSTIQQVIPWDPYTSSEVHLAGGEYQMDAPMVISGDVISVIGGGEDTVLLWGRSTEPMLSALDGAEAVLMDCYISSNDTSCSTLIFVENASVLVSDVVVVGIVQDEEDAVVKALGHPTYATVNGLQVKESTVGSVLTLLVTGGATSVDGLLMQDVSAFKLISAELSSEVVTVMSNLTLDGVTSEQVLVQISTMMLSPASAIVSMSSVQFMDWSAPSFAVSGVGINVEKLLILNATDWSIDSAASGGGFICLEHAFAAFANVDFWNPVLHSLIQADHSSVNVDRAYVTSGNLAEAAFFLSGKTTLSVTGLRASSTFLNDAFVKAEFNLGQGQSVSFADSFFENMQGTIFSMKEVPFFVRDTVFVACPSLGEVSNERQGFPVILSSVAVIVESAIQAQLLTVSGLIEILDCLFLSQGAHSSISLYEATLESVVTISNSSFVDISLLSKVRNIAIDHCTFLSSVTASDSVVRGTASSLRLDEPLVSGLIVSCAFAGGHSVAVGSPGSDSSLGGALQVASSRSALVTLSDCTFNRTIGHYGGAINVEGAALHISDTHFVECQAGFGGAIYSRSSDAVLQNVSFYKCSALSSGGGLYAELRSNISLTDTTFTQCQSGSSGGGIQLNSVSTGTFTRVHWHECASLTGGGMTLAGLSSPALEDCSFTGCSAAASGGALATVEGALGYFREVTIMGNTANSFGGGIFIGAAASPTFDRVHIARNYSPNSGGGVSVQDSAQPTFVDTVIDNNTCDSIGGGLHFAVNSTGAILNCTIRDNSAMSQGGGIVVQDNAHPLVLDTDILRNSATTGGGAVFSQSAHAIIENCHFNDNVAVIHGGGIAASDYSACGLTNCTVSGNQARSGSGGGLAISGLAVPKLSWLVMRDNFAGKQGGAVFHESLSDLHVENSVFGNNTADLGGGAIFVGSPADVLVSHSQFRGNRVTSGSGGAILAAMATTTIFEECDFRENSAEILGGGAFVVNVATFYANHCSFEGNTCSGNGGGIAVVLNDGGTMFNSSFIRNKALTGQAGGAFLSSAGLDFIAATFGENVALNGGGLALEFANLIGPTSRFIDCIFTGNIALNSGGAVELTASSTTGINPEPNAASYGEGSCSCASRGWKEPLTDESVVLVSNSYPFARCIFTANVASQHGGAVMLGAVRLGIGFENCTFQRNIAREFGGALYAQTSNGNTLVKNGTFIDNDAGWAGCNFGFDIVREDDPVLADTCLNCFLSVPPNSTGYQNEQGFATSPQRMLYLGDSGCPNSVALNASPFSLAIGMIDSFDTVVVGQILSDQLFLIQFNYTGTNCTVLEPDPSIQPILETTASTTFSNITFQGMNNSTCSLMFTALTHETSIGISLKETVREECTVTLGGCLGGQQMIPEDGYDICEDPSYLVEAIILGMIGLLCFLVVVLLLVILVHRYRTREEREREAYYAALEIDDEILQPGNITLNDVLNDPEINRIPWSELSIGKRIGRGASGIVCAAVWTRDGVEKDVATKELLLRVEEMDSQAMQDFLVEIKLMSALRNKRVVQFLGVTYFDETLYLVTELMQYGSLRDVLTRKGKNLSWKLKTKLLVDAAMGMKYLHSKKLIHRDLKPQNLLVNNQWVCKVADFGVSTIKSGTRTMTAIGTPVYMAPEVLNNERYSEKADVYSFGILMVEVYTNRRPYSEYSELNEAQLMYRIYHDKLQPDASGLPPLLQQLVDESLSRSSKLRPSFEELVLRLTRLAAIEMAPHSSSQEDLELIVPPSFDSSGSFEPSSLSGTGGTSNTAMSFDFSVVGDMIEVTGLDDNLSTTSTINMQEDDFQLTI